MEADTRFRAAIKFAVGAKEAFRVDELKAGDARGAEMAHFSRRDRLPSNAERQEVEREAT